jgi:asparagine synthase (glutamine-hydrolysing)
MLNNFWELEKRGPDNSSLEIYNSIPNNIAIGFHRLAIMDNSFKSNQPFFFQERTRSVIFICNGEIYNFKYLSDKYDLGISNNSDCLTIPKLYLKFGNNGEFKSLFNDEIKGEFSFLLFEFDNLKNLRKLIVGRDQVGIRPLYYSDDSKNDMIFSSEIKGMKSYEGHVSEFPPGNLFEYNFENFKNTLTKFTFKNVYFTLSKFTRNLNDSQKKVLESDILDNIRNKVINAVRLRLEADRPLAFLLSGGVDSSLVCAIAAKLLKSPINTFCCGMGEGTDLQYAYKVANHIGSNHKEVIFTEDEGFNAIPEVINAIESWDTTTVRASVGQYLVSKYIGTKTDCKVVLVGEGPDEVCSSYMFNWNAPNGEELHKTAMEYVDDIHYFDCKRSDRCISNWGLEGRVPLLDPDFIKAYWEIPEEWRHPNFKGIEKYWLRKAFDGYNLLPDEVLWRKKEAFSDGVSGKKKSWFDIIQQRIEVLVDENYLENGKKLYKNNVPPTKESFFYRGIFTSLYGIKRDDIIKKYWQPKWTGKEGEYVDPSARLLNAYNQNLDVKKKF